VIIDIRRQVVVAATAVAFGSILAASTVEPTVQSRPPALQRLGDPGLLASFQRQPAAAEVTSVRSGGAAERAGVRKGDRIIRVNGQAIQSDADLDDRLFRMRAGTSLNLTIERGGAELAISVTLPPLPTERFPNATVALEEATSRDGDRVRLIVTRPTDAAAPLPVVFVVGWLSCDSVEYPFGETDGFGAILRRLADQPRYVTVRVDKPGIGDSEGPPCRRLDFRRELSAYRAAFASLARFSFIDRSRVFVLGLSNGGGFAPLATQPDDDTPPSPVRGYLVAGAWGKSWFEHMLEHERRRLMRTTASGTAIDAGVKAFSEFYSLFLIQKQTPGAILAARSQWRSLWYDSDDGMYGRPAAFYQQLQELNLTSVWERAGTPTLVVRGAADTVMSRGDAEAVAMAINRAHPGLATYREIDGADHLLMRGDSLADDVMPLLFNWIAQRLGP
jgi:pimeloyl-ACP methyl ester carboxylesterase